MKKTIKPIEPVSTTVHPEVDVKFETEIKPLELNPNLGRDDLNEAFKKVEDKINELIRKQ